MNTNKSIRPCGSFLKAGLRGAKQQLLASQIISIEKPFNHNSA